MRGVRIELLTLWVAVSLIWPSAAGSAVLRLSESALAERSKYIVTGEVLELKSYRGQFLDLGEVIFTDVKIRVNRVLKGRPEGTEITVQVPGGEIGRSFQICPDAPRYEKGEKVLLFLREYNGRLWNTGWLQGKYRLIDSATIVRGVEGLPVSADIPLSSLEAHLRGVIQASSSAESPASSAAGAPSSAASTAGPSAQQPGGSK
jgi:hypothetical protein